VGYISGSVAGLIDLDVLALAPANYAGTYGMATMMAATIGVMIGGENLIL